jgi:hypothetical protein
MCRSNGSVASQPLSDSSPSRRGRRREPKLPSERDWERSDLLEPRTAPRQPEMVSDGGGLPFAPGALEGVAEPLDSHDPAVAALQARLAARSSPKPPFRAPWRREAPPPPVPSAGGQGSLEGWRLLARTDDEALFGRGRPPQLVTVAFRRDARRQSWVHEASSKARPLRAARDGIRASSWRLDPMHKPQPQDTVLRVLVTEQTFSGGQRASGRVLAPDLHLGSDQVVVTLFVTARPGYQAGSTNPETPVRITLPEALGHRRLIDGALVQLWALTPGPEQAAASDDHT